MGINVEDPDRDDARVQVSFTTFDRMRTRLAEQEREINALKAQLLAATFEAAGPIVEGALRAALPIVGFAVGNLHPLTVRGWPWHRLAELAGYCRHPALAHPLVEPELTLTWDDFALLARKWEDARARGEERALLVEENAGRAITPSGLAAYGLAATVAPPAHGEPMLLPIAPDEPPEPVSNFDGQRNE